MRSEGGEVADVMCRAPYGTAEIDSIKLKECNSCDHLLRYCSVACQEDHAPQHEQDYKRAAEKRDDILYRQPESSHLGDCPICLLPLSLDTKHSIMQSCCSKMTCIGCYCASIRYEVAKMIKIRSCPFCRQPEPKTEAEIELYKMKRRKVNDLVAIQEAGKRRYHDGDYEGAFDYFSKAAGLGDEAEAYFCLSFMYKDGKGVGKDAAKRLYHLEEAAIGGQPKARHDLGVHEVKRGRIERVERAVKPSSLPPPSDMMVR